jgi:hypothetical protein
VRRILKKRPKNAKIEGRSAADASCSMVSENLQHFGRESRP